jgi:hypothetical protein
MTAPRVLFLDLDGVLNSVRSTVGLGGCPHGLERAQVDLFDPVALGLVRGLCRAGGVSVVLSSSWRILHHHANVAAALDLPIIDQTPSICGPRGREIATWLERHPEVTDWAILDDDADMLPEQLARFARVDGFEGLSWAAFVGLCRVFRVNPHDCAQARARKPVAQPLDWSNAA